MRKNFRCSRSTAETRSKLGWVENASSFVEDKSKKGDIMYVAIQGPGVVCSVQSSTAVIGSSEEGG